MGFTVIKKVSNTLLAAMLILTGVISYQVSTAAMPRAGSVIDNIALGEYRSNDGNVYSINSNQVELEVGEVRAVDLIEDHSVEQAAGTVARFPHRFINNGNVVEEVSFSISQQASPQDDYDFNLLELYIDANNNGTLDGTDPVYTGQSFTLEPNEYVDLLVRVRVPNALPQGDVGRVDLVATTVSGSVLTNTDEVIVKDSVGLEVIKTAEVLAVDAGGDIPYVVRLRNIGNLPADPREIIIDDTTRQAVVVRDDIPANTVFSSVDTQSVNIADPSQVADSSVSDATLQGSAVVLYHLITEPTHEYTVLPPNDLNDVDAIAIAYFDTLDAGETFTLKFTVTTNSNAADRIFNDATGHASFDDELLNENSNTVETPVNGNDPTLTNFGDDSYDNPRNAIGAGSPLYPQLNAAACNANRTEIDPLAPEVYEAQAVSQAGDFVTVQLVETGVNTGLFVPTPALAIQTELFTGQNVDTSDDVLVVLEDDIITITALADCADGASTEVAVLEVLNVVYATNSLNPLGAVTVRLIDINGVGAQAGYANCGTAGGVACVFDINDVGSAGGSVTPVVNGGEVVTDQTGEFSFPAVLPGLYRYELVTPQGYVFASIVAPNDLPGFWDLDPQTGSQLDGMSYGQQYEVPAANGNQVIVVGDFFDVPVDLANLNPSLLVNKQVNPTQAKLGDSVEYTVDIYNATGAAQEQIIVRDVLPQGFFYIANTSRINGEKIADPEFDVTGGLLYTLNFCLPNQTCIDPNILPAFPDEPDVNEKVTLTYRVRVGVGALDGDRTNRATASTETPLSLSGTASVTLGLLSEVFSDEGYIVGKVYMECSFDREQGHEELGIPGIRIYMEDGSYAVTDAEGQYSFYGVRAGTHVLKIDEETLPVGSEMKPLYNRHAGVGTSQFVDLKQGDIARADFAEGGCYKEIERQVKQRRSRGEIFVSEVEKGLKQDLRIEGFRPVADPKRRGASGLIGDANEADLSQMVGNVGFSLDTALAAGVQKISASALKRAVLTESEIQELAKVATSEIGFINLQDGASIPADTWNVQISGPINTPLKLLVNGVAVGESRLGQNAVDTDRKVAVAEYIAVPLQPGINTLEVARFDNFGNQRDTKSITVTVPAELADIRLESPDNIEADGVTQVPLTLRLVDQYGTPRPSYMPVTLLANDKIRWLVEDLEPEEPGLQIFMQGASTATIPFYGPQTAETITIEAKVGTMSKKHEIDFVPELREMIGVGFVEGLISLSNFDGGSVQPSGLHDGFERELQAWSWENDDGTKYAGVKAKFFLKGKVLGKYLLTASFDSDKEEEERLFRDIRPDEFYPVYGDSSVRGFDAQSTSRMYVRLDRGQSWLQWGDATSGGSSNSLSLAKYSRAMTGLKGHLDLGKVKIDAYAAEESSKRVVEEIEADSGFEYLLNQGDIIPNSETIEIISRRRQQLSVVETDCSATLTRFEDYTVNYVTGRIVFLEAISGNGVCRNNIDVRHYIRATYEVESGGPRNLLTGAAISAELSDSIKVAAEYAHDEDPDIDLRAGSVGAEVKLGEKTTLKMEYARTKHLNPEYDANDPANVEPKDLEGDAASVDISHRGESWDARIFAKQADDGFGTSTGSVTSGATEGGADLSVRIGDKTTLRTDAGYSESNAGDRSRRWGNVALTRRIGEKFNVSVGGGYNRNDEEVEIDPITGQTDTVVKEDKTVDVKIDSPLPWLEDGSAFVEYRKDIKDAGQQSIALGAEYQFTSRTKLSVRHEIENSLDARGAGSSDSAQRTTLDVSAGFGESGEVFGGFTDRIRSGANGRDLNATIGLRQKWSIGNDYNLGLTAEHSRKILGEGEKDDQYTATLTGEYVGSELWKASGRIEGRYSKKQWAIYNTIGIGRKLSRDWVLLTKNTFEFVNNTENDHISVSDRLQIGFAYRDTDRNKWQALLRYELEVARDEAQDQRKLAHVITSHLNYQISENMHVSGRLAVKRVNEKVGDERFNYVAHLIGMRWGWDFSERWDAGLIMSYMRDRHAQNYGFGAEIGYLLYANLWISAGYNFWGYDDKEFSGNDYTNPGWFMRFRYKFDESLFSRGNAEVNNSIIPPRD